VRAYRPSGGGPGRVRGAPRAAFPGAARGSRRWGSGGSRGAVRMSARAGQGAGNRRGRTLDSEQWSSPQLTRTASALPAQEGGSRYGVLCPDYAGASSGRPTFAQVRTAHLARRGPTAAPGCGARGVEGPLPHRGPKSFPGRFPGHSPESCPGRFRTTAHAAGPLPPTVPHRGTHPPDSAHHAVRTAPDGAPQGHGEPREKPTTGRGSGDGRDHPSGAEKQRRLARATGPQPGTPGAGPGSTAGHGAREHSRARGQGAQPGTPSTGPGSWGPAGAPGAERHRVSGSP
jgi:hypothetical protein